ncbi:MAG: UvrD-helicase domain-containing protein [Saprospiraceae bacterium]|nr:UvrD-helicase domain-containing protein [Saprospiraceae bacterium]
MLETANAYGCLPSLLHFFLTDKDFFKKMNLKIISAGAGSGKTYRLTQELVGLLASGNVRASGIIATTFTNKAAAELQERVRVRLLEEGLTQAANDLSNALIGTVHGLGVKLLKRFAYEAGVSPQVDIIADEDQQMLFNQSLSMVLTNERVEEMERLSDRLGLSKSVFGKTDWRKLLKDLAEVVRANDFSEEVLEVSKQRSFETFARFLDPVIDRTPEAWNELINEQIVATISRLENNGDTTKVTADGTKSLREIKADLRLRGSLNWHQWAKISKTKVGARSRDDLEELVAFANTHLGHAGLRDDVKSFIFNIFELAAAAIEEFERFKKSRGLIDYNDMESYVKRLLDDPTVQEVLAEELDLLLVDEFQDTNPLQLEIFLKLSRFARHSIWVGDPKQSIYGFRGADPLLMQAIIEGQGGLQPENILAHSWRSREDVVFATNAIFTKAFSNLPAEQVALQPKRRKLATPDAANKQHEPPEMGNALVHWYFNYDGEGRKPGKEWLHHCIAEALRINLERGISILPKGEKNYRLAQPGDVAILCRSNADCRDVAGALHRAGLRAAISRAGLMATAEAKLILACLKFILNKYDSLSVAEILLLAARLELHEIVEDRLAYLEASEEAKPDYKWGEQYEFVQQLNALRPQVAELSGSEILSLLLEELDLQRIIVTWGNVEQRLANVDMLIHFSLQYEQACNRLHSAASLGGFLLWANDLAQNENDLQGSGENPLAVNVLTYHKSKGLEYPIVICHSLEQSLREDVWGISLVPDSAVIDLDNLLGNRWVRLWVNPYADQFKGTMLEERMADSPEKAQKRVAALAEDNRLMYVGLTRARDYLVFPTREKQPIWLNRVCNNGQEEQPALDANSNETYWDWEGKTLMISTEVSHFPNDFPHATLQEATWNQISERSGRREFPVLTAISEADSNGNQLTVLSQVNCFSAFSLPEVPERQRVAAAFKDFLVATSQGSAQWKEAEISEQLITRLEVQDLVEPADFLEKSKAFNVWLKSHFQILQISACFPVRKFFDGKLFEANIDLLLETADRLVVLKLSKFVGDGKNRQRSLKNLVQEMRFEKQILKEQFGKQLVDFWVVFVLYGEAYELGI